MYIYIKYTIKEKQAAPVKCKERYRIEIEQHCTHTNTGI